MTQPEPAPTGGHPLLRKTTQALAVMVCVLAVPYATPRLARLRVVRAPWDHTHRDFASSDGVPAPITRVGETKLSATKNRATVTNALPDDDRVPLDAAELAKAAGSVAIEDPTGEMGAFYKRLAATLRGDKGAVTRILHYGDSVIASDYVSGTMRRRMQERFGDAGHGFIATANPWEWYFHNDVSHRASDGWSVSRITGPLVRDGMYGLGGASFHTTGVATATFGTAARGEFGRKVSRFDVYYLEQPWGGSFQMEVHGRAPVVVSTRGPAKVSRKVSVSVPDGAASMTIRTLGGGDVRMFGVVLERDVPGVVYDALGALGGRANLWEAMNAEHWKEQLQLRDPALVILQYGTNESEMGHIDDALYTKWMTDLIGKVRDAVPSASILVAAPLDRAEKDDDGNLRTMKTILQIVALQEKIAKEEKLAFWNTFEAMGGKGSMARWVKKGFAGSDLTHPSPEGAIILGDLFFKALVTGYAAYASRDKSAPVLDAGLD